MAASLVLTALVLVAGTLSRTGRPGAVALALLSLLWLLTNAPMEGATLVQLSDTHGITGADLAGVAGLGLALWRWRDTSH